MEKTLTGVAAIILDDDENVLINRRTDRTGHAPGLWSLPCGVVEEGESPEDALKREMKEELGVEVAVEKLISRRTFDNRADGRWVAYGYLCSIVQGIPGIMEPQKSEELKFVPLDKIPHDFFRELLHVIEDYTAGKHEAE
jgi:8-oxo-dGTP diphosphatase